MSERLQPFSLLKNHLDALQMEQKVLASLLELNPNASYLDLGCYEGENTSRMAKMIDVSTMYGLDCQGDYLLKAKERGITITSGDLQRPLPFADTSFDVITATQVIEHLLDTDFFLKEIKRVLKNSGYCVITTNNLAAWHNRIELLLGRQPRCLHPSKFSHNPSGAEPPFSGHKSVFTYNHLKDVLGRHNFIIEASGTHTVYLLPVVLSNVITQVLPQFGTYSYFKFHKADHK